MKAGRLLGPNETKFWLMDVTAPMNSVVVMRSEQPFDAAALCQAGAFRLPQVVLDAQSRPRWGQPIGGGVLVESRESDWLAVAERLTDVRVGSEGHPPWHAELLPQAQGSLLVVALHHALTDYRTALWVAHCLVQGRDPGALSPPCEELLDPGLFSAPDAETLIDDWWSARAGARWSTIGIERLAQALPAPCRTRLAALRLSRVETRAFERRCEREGVTRNGALAVALRDAIGAGTVAHSIDLSRFIKPALDDGPGMAISHLATEVPAGDFWEAAREVRSRVFEGVMAGAAADALLPLPRALMTAEPGFRSDATPITITGAPTLSRPDQAYAGYSKQLVVGSPRAGGQILILSQDRGCLELLSSGPAELPELPLQAIVGALLRAVRAVRAG